MLREFIFGLLVQSALFISRASTQSCPAISNVAQACVSASYTGPRVLVDMSTFTEDVSNCTCTFSTDSKVLKIVTYNAPNYQDCNSAIRMSSTSGNSVRFQCLMSGTYLDTSLHNTGEINFETYAQDYDTNYCLVMEQAGVPGATVTVTCNGPAENTTQSDISTAISLDIAEITTARTLDFTTPISPDSSPVSFVSTPPGIAIDSNNTTTFGENASSSVSASSSSFVELTDGEGTTSNRSSINNNMNIEGTDVSTASLKEYSTNSTDTKTIASSDSLLMESNQSAASSPDFTSTSLGVTSANQVADNSTNPVSVEITSPVNVNANTNMSLQDNITLQTPNTQDVESTSHISGTNMDNTSLKDAISFVVNDTHTDSVITSSTVKSSATVTDIVTGTVLLHGGDTSEKRYQFIDPVNIRTEGVTAVMESTTLSPIVAAEPGSKSFISADNETQFASTLDSIAVSVSDSNVSKLEMITENNIISTDKKAKDMTTTGLYLENSTPLNPVVTTGSGAKLTISADNETQFSSTPVMIAVNMSDTNVTRLEMITDNKIISTDKKAKDMTTDTYGLYFGNSTPLNPLVTTEPEAKLSINADNETQLASTPDIIAVNVSDSNVSKLEMITNNIIISTDKKPKDMTTGTYGLNFGNSTPLNPVVTAGSGAKLSISADNETQFSSTPVMIAVNMSDTNASKLEMITDNKIISTDKMLRYMTTGTYGLYFGNSTPLNPIVTTEPEAKLSINADNETQLASTPDIIAVNVSDSNVSKLEMITNNNIISTDKKPKDMTTGTYGLYFGNSTPLNPVVTTGSGAKLSISADNETQFSSTPVMIAVNMSDTNASKLEMITDNKIISTDKMLKDMTTGTYGLYFGNSTTLNPIVTTESGVELSISADNETQSSSTSDMIAANMSDSNVSKLDMITKSSISPDVTSRDVKTGNYGLFFGNSMSGNTMKVPDVGESNWRNDLTTNVYDTSSGYRAQESTTNSYGKFSGSSKNDRTTIDYRGLNLNSDLKMTTNSYGLAAGASERSMFYGGNTEKEMSTTVRAIPYDNSQNEMTTINYLTTRTNYDRDTEMHFLGSHSIGSDVRKEISTNKDDTSSSTSGHITSSANYPPAERTTKHYMTTSYNGINMNMNVEASNQMHDVGNTLVNSTTTVDSYDVPIDNTGTANISETLNMYDKLSTNGTATQYITASSYNGTKINIKDGIGSNTSMTDNVVTGNLIPDESNALMNSTTTVYSYGVPNDNINKTNITDTFNTYDKPSTAYDPVKDYAQPDLTNSFNYPGVHSQMDITTRDINELAGKSTNNIDTSTNREPISKTSSFPSSSETGTYNSNNYQTVGNDNYGRMTTSEPHYFGRNQKYGMSTGSYGAPSNAPGLDSTTRNYGIWLHNKNGQVTGSYGTENPRSEFTTKTYDYQNNYPGQGMTTYNYQYDNTRTETTTHSNNLTDSTMTNNYMEDNFTQVASNNIFKEPIMTSYDSKTTTFLTGDNNGIDSTIVNGSSESYSRFDTTSILTSDGRQTTQNQGNATLPSDDIHTDKALVNNMKPTTAPQFIYSGNLTTAESIATENFTSGTDVTNINEYDTAINYGYQHTTNNGLNSKPNDNAYQGNQITQGASTPVMERQGTYAFDTASRQNFSSFDTPTTLFKSDIHMDNTNITDNINDASISLYHGGNSYPSDNSNSTINTYTATNVSSLDITDATQIRTTDGDTVFASEQTTKTATTKSESANTDASNIYTETPMSYNAYNDNGVYPGSLNVEMTTGGSTLRLSNNNVDDTHSMASTPDLKNDAFNSTMYNETPVSGTSYPDKGRVNSDMTDQFITTNNTYPATEVASLDITDATQIRTTGGNAVFASKQTTYSPNEYANTKSASADTDMSNIYTETPMPYNANNNNDVYSGSLNVEMTTGDGTLRLSNSNVDGTYSTPDMKNDTYNSTLYSETAVRSTNYSDTERVNDIAGQFITTAGNRVNINTYPLESNYERTEPVPTDGSFKVSNVVSDGTGSNSSNNDLLTIESQQTSKTVVKLESTIDSTLSSVDAFPTTMPPFEDIGVTINETRTPTDVPTAPVDLLNGNMEVTVSDNIIASKVETVESSVISISDTHSINTTTASIVSNTEASVTTQYELGGSTITGSISPEVTSSKKGAVEKVTSSGMSSNVPLVGEIDTQTSEIGVTTTKSSYQPTTQVISTKAINTSPENESTTKQMQKFTTKRTSETTKTVDRQTSTERVMPDIIVNDVIDKKESPLLDAHLPGSDVKPTTKRTLKTATMKKVPLAKPVLPAIDPNDAVIKEEHIVNDAHPPPIEIRPTTKRTFARLPESTPGPVGDSGTQDMATTTGNTNVSFGDTFKAGLFDMNNKTYIIVVAAIAGLVVLAAILGIVIHHGRRNRSDKVDISAGLPEPISHRNLAYENGDPEKGNVGIPIEMNGNGSLPETSGNGINQANGQHSSIEA